MKMDSGMWVTELGMWVIGYELSTRSVVRVLLNSERIHLMERLTNVANIKILVDIRSLMNNLIKDFIRSKIKLK